MPIKRGDVIKVFYEASYKDGTVFDSTEMNGGEPLKFQIGVGQIIGGFEDAVIGMEVGEEKNFTLQPTEAYGEFNPLLVEKLDASQFPGDISLELGKQIEVVGPNGMSSPGWIRLIEKDFILVDMNHPCAGRVINFKIKVVETGLEPDPVQNPFSFGLSCDGACDHH
jgi:FKBP-type peptidyl-prolyl cis-trans isomerase 2